MKFCLCIPRLCGVSVAVDAMWETQIRFAVLGFHQLVRDLPFRRENWPRPRFFPMPVVRWETTARLDASEHLLRRLWFASLP